MDDKDRLNLYLSLRDKHLAQLMEINGKAAFALLTLFASVVVGADKIKALQLQKPWSGIVLALVGFAALSLMIGAFRMSSFHTKRIRLAEAGLAKLLPEEKEVLTIIPPNAARLSYPYHWIFAGCAALVLATLAVLAFVLL